MSLFPKKVEYPFKNPHRMGRGLLPDPTKDTLKDYHTETHFVKRIEY